MYSSKFIWSDQLKMYHTILSPEAGEEEERSMEKVDIRTHGCNFTPTIFEGLSQKGHNFEPSLDNLVRTCLKMK